jgi:hypothetical protein
MARRREIFRELGEQLAGRGDIRPVRSIEKRDLQRGLP